LTLLHNPPNRAPIDTLYAVVSIDAEGRMGICAEVLPGIGTTPFVTGSLKALDGFKRIAREAQAPGKRLAVVTFTRVMDEPEWL
jgi:hypothetical protein